MYQEIIDSSMSKLLKLKLEIRRAQLVEELSEGFNVAEANEEYRNELTSLFNYIRNQPFWYHGYTYKIDHDMLYSLQLWQLV